MQRSRIQLNPEEKGLTAAEVRESGSPGRRVAEAQSGSAEGGGEPEGWDEGRPNRGGHGCYSHHFSQSSPLCIVSCRVVSSELLVNGVPSSGWGEVMISSLEREGALIGSVEGVCASEWILILWLILLLCLLPCLYTFVCTHFFLLYHSYLNFVRLILMVNFLLFFMCLCAH